MSCRGTVQLPACRGERLFLETGSTQCGIVVRDRQRKKRQKDAYQAVLSPSTSSGLPGDIPSPLTFLQKPLFSEDAHDGYGKDRQNESQRQYQRPGAFQELERLRELSDGVAKVFPQN